MERFLVETSNLDAGEPPRRPRSLLDWVLRRRGGKLPAFTRDPDVVPVMLSPGRLTRRRPGESWAEATNRLTDGRDL